MMLKDKKYKYQLVYERIKEQILAGNYQPHEKLLSKRKISEQFNVSINSVIVALDQLIVEGYVYSLERKGYFVEDITRYDLDDQEWSGLPAELKEQPIERPYQTSFSHMASNMSLFPYNEWLKCEQKAIQQFNNELSHLSHQQGPYIVRQTLAQHLNFKRGVRCEPEQVVLHSSSQALMSQLLELFDDAPHTIALENPGYARYKALIEDHGWDVLTVPLDEKGFDVERLQNQDVQLVCVTPAHQFPMGMIMPISRRFELLNWVNVPQERYIIEDDYDSEFRYTGKPIAALQGMDRKGKVIYMSTFSKSLMPSLRIAYFVLPESLLPQYNEMYSYYTCTVPRIDQYTLSRFMKDGYFSKHLNRMRKIYRRKLESIIEVFNEYNHCISITGEQAGMHIMINAKHELNAKQLSKLALQNGIRISAIEQYLASSNSDYNQQLLLGFGGILEDDIQQAIHQLMTCWQINKKD